jgi:HK97 family phage portal protein
MFRRAYTRPRQTRDFTGVEGVGPLGMLGIPPRSGVGKYGGQTITQERALRHSAVWACRRIRADLISTFPVDVFRNFDGIALEMPKPPVMIDPGGIEWDFVDWMWASQGDLDMSGNSIGLIRERNALRNTYFPDGLPSLIELVDARACSVITYKGKTMYRIDGKIYNKRDVWHERQYPLAGSPIGLSPLVYAAASIGEYLAMQQYGLDWFNAGGIPKAWMRNTTKLLQNDAREDAKQWYEDTVRNGDLMVTGKDWEYNMIQAENAGMEWIEGRKYSQTDISRFFGVPADLIDAAVAGSAVTYANISQRNLQFLIMNLGPVVKRREKNLSKLLPTPRYVKLNTDALLRMDPLSRQQIIRSRIETWTLTNSEARALDNLPPLSPGDLTEMQGIYGAALAGKGSLIADPNAQPEQPSIEGETGEGETVDGELVDAGNSGTRTIEATSVFASHMLADHAAS